MKSQERSLNRDPQHTTTAAANGEFDADLSVILASLQTMRDGDFSVRLPGSWTGLTGKIADTFNDIVAANQQIAHELKRVGQVVGKEGRTRERTRFNESRGAWGGGHPRHRGGCSGKSDPDCAIGS